MLLYCICTVGGLDPLTLKFFVLWCCAQGLPDWAEIVTETPVLDSLMSKLER